jgi:hypothetical protein
VAGGGSALLEIGGDQEPGIRELAAARLPGWDVTIERDLGGLPRVAVLRRPSGSVPARVNGPGSAAP